MALARIFSPCPEHTTALARQLQDQGYDVEVRGPGEPSATAADLEIQIETCDPHEILERAAELAARLHADIVVAPGVLPVVPAKFAPAPAPALAAEIPVTASETASLNPASDAANEQQKPAPPGLHVRAFRTLGDRLGTCIAGTISLLALARAEFRERLERSRVHAAEARVRRHEILLDLTRRRFEAVQRALDLDKERRAATVALVHAKMDLAKESSSARAGHGRIWRISTRDATLAVSACLAACFTVGVLVASFHSRPVQSPSSGTAGQGVTVTTGGVTLQESKPTPSPLRPSPVVHKLGHRPTAHARRVQRQVPRKNHDLVANDVVVRHVASPKPTPHTQADGWKHFSDMNN